MVHVECIDTIYHQIINLCINKLYVMLLRAIRGAHNPNHQVAITHARHLCYSQLCLDFH